MRHILHLFAVSLAALILAGIMLFAESFIPAGVSSADGPSVYAASGLPAVLKKQVRVLYIKDKDAERIEYGRASKQKSNGYSIFQGSCTDGSKTYHVLYSKRKANRNKCRIIKIDPETKKVIKVSPAYKIYHGNDIAYDSRRKRLVVVHGDGDEKRISIFDPSTLRRKKVKKLSFSKAFKGISKGKAKKIKGVTGIAYDKKHDRFIASVKSKFDYVILNSKFKPVRYIKVKTKGDLQKQGMDIYGKYILRVINKYTKTSIRNYIYIYNTRGRYMKRVRIRTNSEVESLYFLKKKLYFSTYVEEILPTKVRRYSYILKSR